MRIRVRFFPAGPIIVEPNPVVVLRGEPVLWTFHTPRGYAPLSWTIYFEGEWSPFGPNRRQISTRSEDGPPRHVAIPDEELPPAAATEPLPANEPGDFKYGVRIVDERNGKVVGDIDPVIIVLR